LQFNLLLQILAQGDALRKAQAELAARSTIGDLDLEAALPVRRQEMGVRNWAQGDSFHKAQAEISVATSILTCATKEEKRQHKHNKLEYTTKQLTEICTQFYPDATPVLALIPGPQDTGASHGTYRD
jgi:hypothetical protein